MSSGFFLLNADQESLLNGAAGCLAIDKPVAVADIQQVTRIKNVPVGLDQGFDAIRSIAVAQILVLTRRLS